MTDRIYVTTTIPYVNARPHVGFALELVQADALARSHRLLGRDVRFQTGTDDNALSNVLSARERGLPVEELVEKNSAAFAALARALDVSHDRFLRTADPGHHSAVGHFLSSLRPDDLYVAPYRGLYCPRCEDFWLERDAAGGRCPDHGILLDEVAEENHFFRLGRYQDALRELISSRRLHVVPESREAEVLAFVDGGLNDFSISRSRARAGGWGVPFPGDPEQVVYVWVDALVNYLSGLGYPARTAATRFWAPDARRVHVIGKNVWKFHAIYWPALLLSAGLDVPDRVLVHGFLTHEGRKISKSRGDTHDPLEYITRFGADAVRWYLLAHVRPFEDTDFTVQRLDAVYAADLANTLGNLFSRLTALCAAAELPGVDGSAIPVAPRGYGDALDGFRFDAAAATLWEDVVALNREIAETRPWEDLKAGRASAVRPALSGWARRLHTVAFWLSPFVPSTAERIKDVLTRPRIRRCPPLFPRTRSTPVGRTEPSQHHPHGC